MVKNPFLVFLKDAIGDSLNENGAFIRMCGATEAASFLDEETLDRLHSAPNRENVALLLEATEIVSELHNSPASSTGPYAALLACYFDCIAQEVMPWVSLTDEETARLIEAYDRRLIDGPRHKPGFTEVIGDDEGEHNGRGRRRFIATILPQLRRAEFGDGKSAAALRRFVERASAAGLRTEDLDDLRALTGLPAFPPKPPGQPDADRPN